VKIDIGPDGKILGTKRVSPNGQVSGFTEYAGRDVLVILPGEETPSVRRDASDLLAEAEAIVRERMELAFREYKALRARFATPEQAARSFLEHLPGPDVRGLVRRADAWIREQLGAEPSGPRSKPPRRTKS
jgi:hypothetical protein